MSDFDFTAGPRPSQKSSSRSDLVLKYVLKTISNVVSLVVTFLILAVCVRAYFWWTVDDLKKQMESPPAIKGR